MKLKNEFITIQEFCNRFEKNPEKTKFELVQTAAAELFEAFQTGYYKFDDLAHLNYAEITSDWLDWPNFQDGGIFEQSIETAANMVLGVYRYYPVHNLKPKKD